MSLWRGAVCGMAAGQTDAPERHPQSRLTDLKQIELGPDCCCWCMAAVSRKAAAMNIVVYSNCNKEKCMLRSVNMWSGLSCIVYSLHKICLCCAGRLLVKYMKNKQKQNFGIF